MLATLLAAAGIAAGPWSYAGLVSNPVPPAASVPPAPAPAPPAIVRPAEAPAPTPPAPLAVKQAAPPTPPAPTVWRLADATGQVWEHADPAQLSAFVRERNSRFYTPFYTAPTYQVRAGRCGPSGCR